MLVGLGGSPAAVDHVLAYCEGFDSAAIGSAPPLPLEAEPHLLDWRAYLAGAGEDPFGLLQEKLPQLNVPIREGVSATEAYARVARRGEPFAEEAFGGRLRLARPQAFRFYVHEHPAGALPVLATSERQDFETLWQALACRSEPRPVGSAVNAQMIAGFINWDRVKRYREEWSRKSGGSLGWPQEMSRVATFEPERFFDRMMLVCLNPYSGVPVGELGLDLDEPAWLERSMALRVEHEFTHYATKRLCGQMRLNLLDEMIADCMGATFALGTFRRDWALRFLGLEAWPQVRPEGRVHTYRGELEGEAFALLGKLTVAAAAGLEAVTDRFYAPSERGRFLLALMTLTLELLASENAISFFASAWERTGVQAVSGTSPE